MSTRINDGGSAFPSSGSLSINGERRDYNDSGMTLRDWFAGRATDQDLNTHWHFTGPAPDYTPLTRTREQAKYAYADAMIAAR